MHFSQIYSFFSSKKCVGHSHLKRLVSLLLIKNNNNTILSLFWYSYVRTTYLSWWLKLYRQSVFMCAHIHVDADVCDLCCKEKSQIPRFYTKDGVYRSCSWQNLKKKKQISRNWPGLLCAEGALPLMAADVNTNLLLVSFTSIYICSITLSQRYDNVVWIRHLWLQEWTWYIVYL